MSGFMDWLMSASDPDHTLSFSTKQQVNILDRYLGITFNILTATVVAYIFGYVFWLKRGYLELETARGTIATHVWGDTIQVSSGKPGQRYFTAEDLSYPGLENGNVFIATRVAVMKQERGICEDPSMPCSEDEHCSHESGGSCLESGFCEEPAWCNMEEKPEKYNVESGEMMIWVKSAIQYIQLRPDKIFSTEIDHPYPEVGYNAFSVRELLRGCNPPVLYEEIAELGAAIEVQFMWRCNVDKDPLDCKPDMYAKRLDSIFDPNHIGFKFKYAEYISEEERVLNTVSGVRMFFRTSGEGREVSIPATVQKFSLNSSLIAIATILSDLLMLKVFALRKKYEARKFEVSPDFSDYLDDLTKKKQDEDERPQREADADEMYQEQEDEWRQQLEENQQ